MGKAIKYVLMGLTLFALGIWEGFGAYVLNVEMEKNEDLRQQLKVTTQVLENELSCSYDGINSDDCNQDFDVDGLMDANYDLVGSERKQ